MSTLDLCDEYFKTRDFYKIFGINKHASQREIKKAFHKLELKFHPDRVTESEKEEAAEKFKIISKLYDDLSDEYKRARYDEAENIDAQEQKSPKKGKKKPPKEGNNKQNKKKGIKKINNLKGKGAARKADSSLHKTAGGKVRKRQPKK